MRLHLVVIAVCLTSLFSASVCRADTGLLRELDRLERLRRAVQVAADRVEYLEGERKVVAKGGVRIEFEGRSLSAEEITVDLDDQVFVATGQVVLTEGANRLEGDRIEYNYRSNLGVFTNGRAFLAPGFTFSGLEIRREGERKYRVVDGRFTTCRVCQPEPESLDWEIRTEDATVYEEEYALARMASLWIRGVPAFFTPVAIVPLKRRTGFLLPRMGYSNRDGFSLRQPFFWAISRSQDATLTAGYRTRRGVDLLGEYRYVLAEDAKGELAGRLIQDREITDESEFRGEFKWLHDQVLSPAWRFKADVRLVSQPRENRQLEDSVVAQREQRTLTSNLFITQATPRFMLLGLAQATQDLASTTTTRTGRVPEVRFQWLPNRIGTFPVVGEGQTSLSYLGQSPGEDAGRFDLAPALHLPLELAPWLVTTSSIGARETAYTRSETGGGASNRLLLDAGERLTSRFARRFDQPGFGLMRLTHIVEPSLAYRYVLPTSQRDLPQFDPVDFISPQNRITYQLTNRLLARWRHEEGEIRSHEVATLEIAQSWNLQPRTREFSNVYLTTLTPERVDQAVTKVEPLDQSFSRAEERTLSNLVASARISPIPAAALTGTLAFNTEDRRTDGINAGFQFGFPELFSAELGYSYVRDRLANGLMANLQVDLVQKSVRATFLTHYDATTGTFLQYNFGLRYGTCCWEVSLNFTNRTQGPGEPMERNVTVQFDFKIPTPVISR